MSNHTPGPWFVGETLRAEAMCIVGDGDSVVCEFPDRLGETVEADARLIAKAPEMLDKLIKCRKEFAGLPHSLGYDFTHLPELDALIAEVMGEAL